MSEHYTLWNALKGLVLIIFKLNIDIFFSNVALFGHNREQFVGVKSYQEIITKKQRLLISVNVAEICFPVY